jgi:hypothetical protein
MLDVRMVVAQLSGVHLTCLLSLAKKLHDEKLDRSAERTAGICTSHAGVLPYLPRKRSRRSRMSQMKVLTPRGSVVADISRHGRID